MKQSYILLLITFMLFYYGQSLAQVDNGLPNNGLTHKMTENERILMNNYQKNILYTNPPVGTVRNIAEFEPTEAVIIAYTNGFGLPYSLIRDLSNSGNVIIACPSSSQSYVLNLLNNNNVNTAACSFLTTSLNSWWTRDYTGWFIADSSNHVAIVDFTYNRPRPLDNAVPALEATFLGIPYYGMNITHTGGNYMCDGLYTGISTVLVSEENTGMTTNQINQMFLDYLGITDYMIRPDAQGAYIEHIDCWAKLLAPDKILVDSVPASDPQYNQYEAAAAFFASTICPYGYPYKVYRPLIAGSAETATAEPYSNSFIFNNKVFVPIKGGASAVHDTAALECYRRAMPGYFVKGYTSTGSQAWYGTDALHCRTHEIADRSMLYIEHFPLFGILNSPTGYDINAKVVSYAGNSISANYPTVIYKVNQGAWDSLSMVPVSYLNYSATIPQQSAGDTVYYYIKAKDNTGKIAQHAIMGKLDPHFFIVDGGLSVSEIINPSISFFTYPNPSKGDFVLFVKSNYSELATINIYTITGTLVYNNEIKIKNGNSMKKIHTENLAKGIYVLEVKTKSNILTNKLVIK